MTHTNPNPKPANLPRPRHYLGNQPVVAVARYHSEKPCNWSMLYHAVADISEPYCGIDFLDLDPSEVDRGKWPLYDYDCEQINNWFVEELEIDGGFEIKWANRCQMHYREDDPLHILRGDNTKVDGNDHPIDGYWEVSVLNRDDAEFWQFLLTDSPMSLDIAWQPRQEAFSEAVFDWIRKNPNRAQAWLDTTPVPADLIGDSDELDHLIKKIKRAIRQGRIPLE
jgi:hypothetical protein